MSVPLVVAEHNIEYTVYETYARKFPIPFLRPIAYVDSIKTKVWEELSWEKAHAVIAVSEEDARVIRTKTKKPVTVVSNGVDTTFFHYKKHAYDKHNPTCLFVGNFAWAPNKEAVHQLLAHVWPAIIQRFPQAKLTIVGKQFPTQMQQFITSSVSVKDSVTDIRDGFNTHDVLLAPMGIGGGTKFKILEAFASGTSVISTKEGVAGIGIEATVCQIAQTPADFVSSLASLYANPVAAAKQTAQARKFVEKIYDWDTIATIQDHVWRDAV
jgi:glycosyltransferase involved in cell wall biosynthesis